MSIYKRRWSNDFLDSLIDFQTRDNNFESADKSRFLDSLESKGEEHSSAHSFENKRTNSISKLHTIGHFETAENNSVPDLVIDDSDNELKNRRSSNDERLNTVQDFNISANNSSISLEDDITNTESNLKDCISDSYENLNILSSQKNYLLDFNAGSKKFNTLSIIKQIKIDYSQKISTKTNSETPSMEGQFIQKLKMLPDETKPLNDVLDKNKQTFTDNISNSDSETIKASSRSSSTQNIADFSSLNNKINETATGTYKKESSQDNQEIIAEMNEPDIWDTLVALEQALSPVDKKAESFEECSQEYPHILNRLSQQFKKTPTRFTEKLVSIIEDSVMSSESPVKQSSHDNSGISLNRMTGEFRKLCKFIEDESMPEWAPSLMNMTGCCSENTINQNEKSGENYSASKKNVSKTNNDVTTTACIPHTLKSLITPKNKILSNINSPINRFTPTSDKSFEYWESVCNMMCDSQTNKKLNKINSLCIPESSKENMNEMLTICERQMASLNDTIDVRNSEPCKKTDNDLNVKIATPRSKSECTITLKTNDPKMLNNRIICNNDDELSNEKLISYNESISSSNKDLEENTVIFQNKFKLEEDVEEDSRDSDEDINFKNYSLRSLENKELDTEMQYDDDKQDCSLLIELAKRRQRCLDTAKLMMEIDREDPIDNEDSTCLETLYKLGIQDKTLNDVENDTTFLSTLSQCIDYKNYISVKSKPLMNMLNDISSSNDLKNKATSAIQSKKLLSDKRKTGDCKSKNQQLFSTTKSSSKPQNAQSRGTQDKRGVNKLPPKSILKQTPRVERNKSSLLSESQQKKKVLPPKVDKRAPYLQDSQGLRTPRTPAAGTRCQPGKWTTEKQKPEKLTQVATSRSCLARMKMPRSDKKTTCGPVPVKKTTQPAQESRLLSRATPKSTTTPRANKEVQVHATSEATPKQEEASTPLPKPKLFVTPGKSPKVPGLGRKKPLSYFTDTVTRTVTPSKADYENVKSVISLYINGIDTDLIQNVHGKINERLLTPVSGGSASKDPKLKFSLSSKENKSPAVGSSENIILPTVRYQSAKQVRLIDDKSSYSPSSITPNSKTKKLLGPIENTVVIRHEGRVINYSPKTDYFNSETSIRVQKMAEKTTPIRKKCI